jgi:dihydroorotase
VFDPAAEWTVDPDAFFSKGRNTPFAGWRLRGRVLATLLAGRFTHVADGVEFAAAPQATGASR